MAASLNNNDRVELDMMGGNGNDEDIPPHHHQQQQRTFHPFSLLHEDLQLCILSYLGQVPLENLPQHDSPVTHVLPFVSHQFYNMCRSDYIWQTALERLVRKEPLWRDGLLKLHPTCPTDVVESPPDLVRTVHVGLNEPGYLVLFQMVVSRHLRSTLPVFIMSGVVRLGQRIDLHFFEPRYRLLIANVMEGYPAEARRGHPIVPIPPTNNEAGGNEQRQNYPTFCYAHMAPFAPTSPACIVEVRQCTVHPNGTADVMLIPTAYVWMERLWQAPNTGRLHYAQCLRMPRQDARQLEESNLRRVPRGFENPIIEMLLQDRGLVGGGVGGRNDDGDGDDVPMGLQLPLRAMLNYLVHEHGNRESDTDDDGDEEEEDEDDETDDDAAFGVSAS